MIGQSIGHYEVTDKLGEGGMGEVYRARDTRLNREVALKRLPESFSGDKQRMGRFSREAQVLASLNHPNIAAIHGLEDSEGERVLVMELVEGEDLSERIARGPIALDEALPIALQIAEALESAHEKGVIHRDLKPANIKLTPDGEVKVLDFGLAKALEDPASVAPASDLSQSPTMTMAATQAGIILGTAAYMSPEQARGKAVDRKSDVWSFGVVFWEMLTGQRLFSGDTMTDTIAAVVTKEPEPDRLPPETPRAVRRLLDRCLRKDPKMRLPDIGGARLELQEVVSGAVDEEDPRGPDEGVGRTRERLAWAAFAVVMAALVAVFVVSRFGEVPEPASAVRFAEHLPGSWAHADLGWPALSPNGSQIVFAARPGEGSGYEANALWSRSLDSIQARQLSGTEGAGGDPFWSPDGRFIGFFAAGELRRLDLATGTVQRICVMPNYSQFGADWNEEGAIIFSSGGSSGQIYSVPAAGGEAQTLTAPDRSAGEVNYHMPQFLPDGERFLFLVGSSEEEAEGLYVSSLSAPDEKRLIRPGWIRSVYASGQLLFVEDGTLLAQPFDAGRAELGGEPVAIASSVASWTGNASIGWFSASPRGNLAYFSGTSSTGRVRLAWLDPAGNQIETVGPPGLYGQIALSPDERNVALEILDSEQQYDLWVMDLGRGVTSRVTATPGSERDPVWAPDGRSLAYVARRETQVDLRRKGLRASDEEMVLADSPDEDIPESWSRDGEILLTVRRNVETDEQSIWAVQPGREGEGEAILDTGFRMDEAQLSPDGRWLAYVSPESGREEVYLEPFHREGDRVRVSLDGGGQPKWGADGRKLYFTDLTGLLMAVEVTAQEDRVDVSLPQELFQLSGFQGPGYDDYAVSADGQRFLVKLPVEQEVEEQLHVIANWSALLE